MASTSDHLPTADYPPTERTIDGNGLKNDSDDAVTSVPDSESTNLREPSGIQKEMRLWWRHLDLSGKVTKLDQVPVARGSLVEIYRGHSTSHRQPIALRFIHGHKFKGSESVLEEVIDHFFVAAILLLMQ
jgi:hypothetical protein